MITYTKADLIQRVQEDYYGRGKMLEKKYFKNGVSAILDAIRELVVDGRSVRLKKIGWIAPAFKKGGRPVRNPKTGVTMAMPDTYNVQIRTNISYDTPKVHAGPLIPELCEMTSLPMDFIEDVYLTFIDMLRTHILEEGNRFELRGFMVFHRVTRSARIGRNPKTGEKVNVAESHSIQIRAPRALTKDINERQGIA